MFNDDDSRVAQTYFEASGACVFIQLIYQRLTALRISIYRFPAYLFIRISVSARSRRLANNSCGFKNSTLEILESSAGAENRYVRAFRVYRSAPIRRAEFAPKCFVYAEEEEARRRRSKFLRQTYHSKLVNDTSSLASIKRRVLVCRAGGNTLSRAPSALAPVILAGTYI